MAQGGKREGKEVGLAAARMRRTGASRRLRVSGSFSGSRVAVVSGVPVGLRSLLSLVGGLLRSDLGDVGVQDLRQQAVLFHVAVGCC